MNDLEKAYNALVGKLSNYNVLFQYADGDQPLVYSTQKLHTVFKNLDARFQQNWITVVIDSALDRLLFKGWTCEDNEVNQLLTDLYDRNQIAIEADETHRAALITHEAFIIAWKDETGELEIYYNDPRMCAMFYDQDNPKKKTFGAKWHVDDDRYYHVTLYYPDRLEYYKSKSPMKQGQGAPRSYKDFVPDTPERADNPFGIIPMFHFRTKRTGNRASDITGILTLQDAVNKLLADMMISAEFGAFKQRWIITNSETAGLKNAPNEIWTIPAGDGTAQTSVGQFEETNLDVFLNAIDKLANSIAIISRTPKHYFYSTGANISGEALIAMESPLIAKVERYQKNFGEIWRELALFLCQLNGKSEIDPKEISVVWEPAQSVQPLTEAQTIKTNIEAGVPLESALRWAGKNEFEISSIMEEVTAEKERKEAMAQAVMEKLRLQQEQSNENPTSQGDENPNQEVEGQ